MNNNHTKPVDDMSDVHLGHPIELIDKAVVLSHGNFVRLDDMLFEQLGLGPRYAQVLTNDYRLHRNLSYAFLDMPGTPGTPGTPYDLITELDNPQDLGSFEDLIADRDILKRLTATFINRCNHYPTHQQLALALIRARTENVQACDELGVFRQVKWALSYERRAHWVSTHHQLAFCKEKIDWQALGL